MNEKQRFDIIIAGAGAAGLSLLWRVLESEVLSDLSILVIDKSLEPADDKTWCFWERNEIPFPEFIHHTWNNLKVKADGQTFQESLRRHGYYCIRNHDFIKTILNKAMGYKNVTLLEDKVHDFLPCGKLATVQTTGGSFRAPIIFQSILKPPDFDKSPVDVSLLQHFFGWEIKCGQDIFDPSTVTLMDFDVQQENGISFIYLLPFSQKRALVEYTIFSEVVPLKDTYERTLLEYIGKNFKLDEDQFSVLREEIGIIPMEDRKYSHWYCKNVMNIGTVTGLAKPSTGYTFSRIQNHSNEIIKALERNSKLPDWNLSSYRFRVYDIMMLYLLQNETENAKDVFKRLFKENRFDLVLQFLSEKTNLFQELSIFSKMPYAPFFRSIYKMKHRIFFGA